MSHLIDILTNIEGGVYVADHYTRAVPGKDKVDGIWPYNAAPYANEIDLLVNVAFLTELGKMIQPTHVITLGVISRELHLAWSPGFTGVHLQIDHPQYTQQWASVSRLLETVERWNSLTQLSGFPFSIMPVQTVIDARLDSQEARYDASHDYEAMDIVRKTSSNIAIAAARAHFKTLFSENSRSLLGVVAPLMRDSSDESGHAIVSKGVKRRMVYQKLKEEHEKVQKSRTGDSAISHWVRSHDMKQDASHVESVVRSSLRLAVMHVAFNFSASGLRRQGRRELTLLEESRLGEQLLSLSLRCSTISRAP